MTLEAALSIRRVFVDGPFGQMHVWSTPKVAERPPLVLLHPSPYSGAYYAHLMRGLLAVAPVVAAARLGASPRDFGALTGAIGSGALAGALGRAFVAARWPQVVRIDVCAVVVAASYGGLALCHGFAPVIGFAALFGVGWTNAAIGFQSRAQLSLPASLRGRGGSIYLTVFALGTLLGGLIAGAVLDHLPLGAALLLATALLCLDPLALRAAHARRRFSLTGAGL